MVFNSGFDFPVKSQNTLIIKHKKGKVRTPPLPFLSKANNTMVTPCSLSPNYYLELRAPNDLKQKAQS